MFESSLTIQSHKGPYRCEFAAGSFQKLAEVDLAGRQFIVDAKVARLYEKPLARILGSGNCVLIEANEENKRLEAFPGYVQQLVRQKARRGDTLVAIGGGVIQDITCFLAATMFRGLNWEFYPTTLLAQADSCIGSKSSINVGDIKNLLGTFTPPTRIFVDPQVIDTLEEREIRSGIGEMLKVHILHHPKSFDAIAADFDQLLTDRECLLRYVARSLEIKKRFIEEDEFDKGIRNVLNYGHSFGHAIETATAYEIPHGIAVTMGMDFANFAASELEPRLRPHFERMHVTLRKNYRQYERTTVPFDAFWSGLAKDKKNTRDQLGLILPAADGIPQRQYVAPSEQFRGICERYLSQIRVAA